MRPGTGGNRWFAAAYDYLMAAEEFRVLSRFRRLIADSARGRVLEIGAGTGANFPYYGVMQNLVATDPDRFMLDRAKKRALKRVGAEVDLVRCVGEALPFADASFDAVVSTLVLCTVGSPERALAEVRRLLARGGVFCFIEHVRSPGLPGHIQDALTPVWRRVAGGCHLNRRTAQTIEAAGFEIEEVRRARLVLVPVIVGVAKVRPRQG